MFNSFDVDAIKRERLEGDDRPLDVVAYQAQKCAAIIEAYVDGQTLYYEYVDLVATFMKAAALEAALGVGYARPSAESVWQQLDALEWPRHGGSQP